MYDMNDMTTVLDQHVQAVLHQHEEDLFTYKVSDSASATAPGATEEKALPELNQWSRNVARTMPALAWALLTAMKCPPSRQSGHGLDMEHCHAWGGELKSKSGRELTRPAARPVWDRL